MKKSYLLLALLLIFAGSVSAQRVCDLQLMHNVTNGVTIVIKDVNPPQYAFRFSFKNLGPAAVTSTDTIYLKTPWNTYKLLLPTAGIPAGDTVYFTDTVGFTSGPANTSSYNWCDSAWLRGISTSPITDPVISNNQTCNTITIYNVPAAVTEYFTATRTSKGVQSLNVYPNPATNSLNIKHDFGFTGTAATLTIRDLVGRVVLRQDLGKSNFGAKEFSFDISQLKTGIYMVELATDNNARFVSKLSVQK